MFYIKAINKGNVKLHEAKTVEIQEIDFYAAASNEFTNMSESQFERHFWDTVMSELSEKQSQDVYSYCSDFNLNDIRTVKERFTGPLSIIISKNPNDIKSIFIPSECAYITNENGATLHSVKVHKSSTKDIVVNPNININEIKKIQEDSPREKAVIL